MNREKKAAITSILSIVHQITTIVCGFILPRFFLANYGSGVNGLISSITSFLGFISLAECGVGAVVRAALYKPLAQKDNEELSRIICSAERFFKRIALILLVYSFILMIVYPNIVIKDFSYVYTASLIVIISISTFAQYYFGITYKLLLASDQRGYISLAIQSVSRVANVVLCIVLMKVGAQIHIVKFVSSLIFLFQPLAMCYIGRHQYSLNRKIGYEGEPISQKWNGLAQHIASVVLSNTDTVVLTLFSTLENVSIYAVYGLVVNGVKQLVDSLTMGVQALFGNMLAKNQMDQLDRSFGWFEWFMHTMTALMFGVTSVLIVPFVAVYTRGITDVNYIVPVFGAMMTIAQGCYCVRLPYSILILTAGHFRQTQGSAIIEALINIVFSIFLVNQFGLIGVAIGTLLAMLYRTIYFAIYLSKNILFRKIKYFIKHCVVDTIMVVGIVSVNSLVTCKPNTYVEWIVLAAICTTLALLIVVVVNYVFYRDELKMSVNVISKKIKR